jgi:hypothetical protein
MSNKFNMNKFNDLISQASDAILCNSECRKQREIDKLKQNYINAQENLASAPNQVQVAEKNYVTFTKGQTAYNDLLDKKLQEQAQIISDKFTENFEEDVKKIKTQINTNHYTKTQSDTNYYTKTQVQALAGTNMTWNSTSNKFDVSVPPSYGDSNVRTVLSNSAGTGVFLGILAQINLMCLFLQLHHIGQVLQINHLLF